MVDDGVITAATSDSDCATRKTARRDGFMKLMKILAGLIIASVFPAARPVGLLDAQVGPILHNMLVNVD